jgi:tetratricopeptide (TPR) repeat protein
MPARTARERWSKFLTFVVMWVLTAIVGIALLFYFTGRSVPPPAAPEPEPTHVALEDRAPEPSPAPVSEDAPEAPAPEPIITEVHDEPAPRTRVRVMTESERASKIATHIRRAATATEAGDYEKAILAYEGALELEPNNFEVKILMAQAVSLRELEAREAGQRFRETRTEVTTDGSRSESRAAELIIEILPSGTQPGRPVCSQGASTQCVGPGPRVDLGGAR